MFTDLPKRLRDGCEMATNNKNYKILPIAFDKRKKTHMDILEQIPQLRKLMQDYLPEEDLESDSALLRAILFNFKSVVLDTDTPLVSPDDLDTRYAIRKLTEQLNRFALTMERAIKGIYQELEKIQSAPRSYFGTESTENDTPPDVFGGWDDDDE